MRPTDLHFRSPKEKTAEFLYPQLTSDGRRIPLLKSQGTTKGSFPTSVRFSQYLDTAKKTGYRVGPGAYNLNQSSIEKKSIKGTPSYHKSHVGKNFSNNGYIYVGHSVVFDPGLMNKSANVLNDLLSKVDASQVIQRQGSQNKSRKSFQESWTSSRGKSSESAKGKSCENGFKLNDSFFKKKKDNYFQIAKNSPKF